MSFMFNPYPYDDPNAINHICFADEKKKQVTANSLASAKAAAEQAGKLLETERKCAVVAVDGYITAPMEQFANQMTLQLVQNGIAVKMISTENLFESSEELHQKLLEYLPEDRRTDPPLLYGRLYKDDMQSLMRPKAIEDMRERLESFLETGEGILILYGYGALIRELRSFAGLRLYIDMTQKRTVLNIRAGVFTNLGSQEHLPVNQVIRRNYYVDFEVASRLRGELFRQNEVDYYLTGDRPEHIQMIPVPVLKDLFSVMVTYPLRCRPVYIEGVWGGFYVKRLRHLPEDMKNCAWVFDLIPMEVSIVADLESMQLEFPFYFFVQLMGKELMGENPAKKFHGYFPIRFNYDDTFHASGNMSIQCHPDGDYVRRHNDELGRQDESYYMVVTGQEAKTYVGFRQDADVEEFISLARRAEKTGEGFDHDAYVYSHPSVAGQQFMIPAGTIHASGRNQVILEIGSLTIGSYTYKMYDYVRKDLDGNLRPIHTWHGDHVLRRDFREEWVRENLIQTPRMIRRGDGFEETIVGQHDLLYFSLRNVKFWERYTDETTDRFHVLVLVEGEKCTIRSLTDPSRFYSQNYLDMVIVPAGFGPYEVINEGVGKVTMHKTLLKDGYENDE